jgi:hypothetical protein
MALMQRELNKNYCYSRHMSAGMLHATKTDYYYSKSIHRSNCKRTRRREDQIVFLCDDDDK